MSQASIYGDVSKYYDMMYVNDETYKAEIDKVNTIVARYKVSNGTTLLDIACGTGAQAAHFQNYYEVTGIDLSEDMLRAARSKVKSAAFIKADMCDFDLGRQFDVIVNLYGSIGYAESVERLRSAMDCAYKHLKSGGVFILTPWSTKESFNAGLVTKSRSKDLSGFCRMETVKRLSDDRVSVEMHHLIAVELNVTYHKHTEIISLFSEDEYINSIQSAGFKIVERLSPDDFRMGAFVCAGGSHGI